MKRYANYYTKMRRKYHDELAQMTPLDREVAIFTRTLKEIPLTLDEDDYIAGWLGDEVEPDQTPVELPKVQVFTEEDTKMKAILADSYAARMAADRGHTCIDYGDVLRNGLKDRVRRIDERLQEEPDNKYLQAMKTELLAIKDFALRLSKEVAQAAGEEKDAKRKEHLLKVSDALTRVPYEPAQDYLEAMQSTWLMQMLIPISGDNWYSISLGRFDQYMLPYYRQAVADGWDQEVIDGITVNFFLLMNGYTDGSIAFNLGGADVEGNDLFNEYSEYLIKIEKRVLGPAPLVCARITKNTPRRIMDELVDESLFTIGQPTFYCEENCKAAVATRDIPLEDAATFSVSSCMGLKMAGRELNNMWGCIYFSNYPLELALNCGKTLVPTMDLPVYTDKEPTSVDEIMEAFAFYANEVMKRAFPLRKVMADDMAANLPNPLLSAMTKGCIEAGDDIFHAAEFITVTVEMMGTVNASDAICAIDQLVFQQKKYTIAQISEAVKNNYEGYEQILEDIKNCPKFGMGDAYADEMAARVCNVLSEQIEKHNEPRMRFLPSLHTLDYNAQYGRVCRATYDGRRTGEPFAKNAGPVNGVAKNGPTSLILSASRLPQTRMSGGQCIDVHVDTKLLKSLESRRKVAQLILTYFKMGGLQFQVNSLNSEILKKAYENPEQHEDLIVRIGGFSERFNWLSDASKLDMIERFEKEEEYGTGI